MIAHVRLLHMVVYSSGTMSMILYGASKAREDQSYFENPIRSVFPHLDDEAISEIIELKKEPDLDTAVRGGQAGSLVLMHAGIEWCLIAVARAIATVSPGSFLPMLEKRQVTLQEALSQGHDELLNDRIESFLIQMDRQSLVERTRTIFRLINDSTISSGIFDEQKIERIEKLRNDCAHGRVGIADFSTIHADLEYLHEVAEFFIETVAKKFEIPYEKCTLP